MDRLSAFYRAWFLYIDPVFGITGPLINTFFPDAFLRSFNPQYKPPASIESRLALDVISAFGLGLLVLQVAIPRRKPSDMWSLKLLTASILVMDVTILCSCARAEFTLAKLDLIGLNEWEGPELINVVLTALIALVRVAFLLGIGVDRYVRDPQRRKKN